MTQSAPNPSAPHGATRYGLVAAVAVACLAGAFVLTVAASLAWMHVGAATDELFNSPQVADHRSAMLEKSDLAAQNQERDELRRVDREVRQRQSARLALSRRGGWMILTGSVVLIAAVAWAASYRKRRPVRRPGPDAEAKARTASWLAVESVAALFLVLGAAGAALGLWMGGGAVYRSAEENKPAVARTFPSWEERAKQWPRFRGPGGSGISAYNNVPTTWNAETGQNIVWKTDVPMPGLNSPIIWGDRIFLSGAVVERANPDEESSKILVDKRAVFCYDAKTGQLLWQKPVETATSKASRPPKVDEGCGYAPSTMVTDGQAVFAIFPNGDIAAFDFDGKSLWTRCVGPLANSYGYATSLEMYQNFLLIQLDQGLAGKARSAVMALDAATGKTVWETRRSVPQSWASPIVVRTDKGDQYITLSKPWAISYDPATGTELWRANVISGENIAPSPVCINNVAYVAYDRKLSAIRVDGKDDVTDTGILWQGEDGIPDIASPLADGSKVWLLTTEGRMTCYDAKDGKKLYELPFEPSDPDTPVSFRSSPAMAADHVYMTEESGITHVLSAADGKEIAKAKVGEKVFASLAFQDGRIYIRGDKHLFAVGAKN